MAKLSKTMSPSLSVGKRPKVSKKPLTKPTSKRGVALFTGDAVSRARRTPPRDAKREKRIVYEIMVDAYSPEEQAMGWYCHLEDELQFPFRARCISERTISPLRNGDAVEVTGMAPDEECEHEMFVMVVWETRALAVPLAQLKPHLRTNAQTKQAVADWHYWLGQGYRL